MGARQLVTSPSSQRHLTPLLFLAAQLRCLESPVTQPLHPLQLPSELCRSCPPPFFIPSLRSVSTWFSLSFLFLLPLFSFSFSQSLLLPTPLLLPPVLSVFPSFSFLFPSPSPPLRFPSLGLLPPPLRLHHLPTRLCSVPLSSQSCFLSIPLALTLFPASSKSSSICSPRRISNHTRWGSEVCLHVPVLTPAHGRASGLGPGGDSHLPSCSPISQMQVHRAQLWARGLDKGVAEPHESTAPRHSHLSFRVMRLRRDYSGNQPQESTEGPGQVWVSTRPALCSRGPRWGC